MTDSTARATRFESDSFSAPVYLWSPPQKPLSVAIPLALIDPMERAAVESFRSLSSRGSEIGGVLFGNALPGSPLIVAVESYQAVECDYTGGPLYRLTEAELSRLDRLIEQRLASGARAVGFYRSHTRKGLSLDPDDLALFESRFREPHHIALLIRPAATRASVAGIFFREDGKINAEQSCLEFPFRSSQHEGAKRAEGLFEGAVAGPRSVTAVPVAARPAARAQIVPIASRREIAPEPALPAPVAAEAEAVAVGAPVEPAPNPEVPAPATPVKKVEPEPPAAAPAAKAAPEPPSRKSAPAAKTQPESPSRKPAPAAKVEPEPLSKKALPVAKAQPESPSRKEAPAGKAEAEPSAKVAPPAAKAEPARPARKESEPSTATSEKTASALKAEAPPATAAEPEAVPRSGSRKLLWVGLGAVASLVLAVGFVFTSGVLHRGARAVPNAQDNSPLNLRVDRNGGDIVLTWNRDSEAVRQASHGVLSISDGPQHENVEMDVPQLRNGSIVYSPVTSDVVFRMEVSGANQAKTVSESVRVLRTKPSPMQDSAVPAQPAGLQPAPDGSAPAAPADSAQAPPEEEKTTLARAVKTFKAESLAGRLRPTAPSEVQDAPMISAPVPTAAGDVNLGGIVSAQSAPLPPPQAAPPSPSAPAPAAVENRPVGGKIQEASLIKRRDPDYPKIARDAGASGVVELVATIGTDGRVKTVKVLRGHPLLRQAAADAVRAWIYRPAILNGIPVESQTQVLLNFKGER